MMAESGKRVSISQSSPSSTKLPDIEQMSPEVLAEFFINSLPQYRSVVTVLADFTRAYRMNGKAFLAISRNDIETLLQVQAPSVVDALTSLQEAATGQRRHERRPKLQLTSVFHDLEGRIPSAREFSADGGTRDELSALEGHDEQWVFNDELIPPTDGDILFSTTTGIPAEDDCLVSPSASTPSSFPRSVPIIFDTSPDMTISPSTFISPQTIINSRDAEFLTALGDHTYPGIPKEDHEESQITDMAGLKLTSIDETLSYGGPIDAHDSPARNSLSVPEAEEFRLGNATHLGTGGDRCIDISSGEANRNESLADWIDLDRLGVFGGQDVHEMKANADVGRSPSSTCSSHDQLSSTPQNNSNDTSRLTRNPWLAPPIELSKISSLPQEPTLPFSPTSDDKYNSSSDRCEDYGLDVSPDSPAIEQLALVIPEHGSRDSPNQSPSPSDADEQIKGNSLSSYKSDGLANTAVLNDSPPFFDDHPLSSSLSREPSDSARYVATISPTASATKGTDGFPVTISPTGINASCRIAEPRLPSPGLLSKNAIDIAGDIASMSDIDAMIPPIAIHARVSGNVESAEQLGGPIGTTDSKKMSPNLEVANSSFYSPDAPLLVNLHPIAEDPWEDDGFALMAQTFSASTGDTLLESGNWIVVPRPSAEESHHSPPPPKLYPAPAISPTEASRHPSVEELDSDVASAPAAGTSFTYQFQGLPEIPCVPLFHDGELELGLSTQTVQSRGTGKESAFPSHKWETDERPFFGQSHASPSLLERRISKSRKEKGKERHDTTYQDKIVQTDAPPVDPSVEDPRIVQLSHKVNRLQEEVTTLKAENEDFKRQTLWSKFFSRSPLKESSSQPTSGNGRDVIRISTFPDLRFVTV
ncbi:hypothetical protein ARMGADRAFT_1057157 [Armillaria gallica]|uniref:Uncharacterized protein n=1 Tax=Armillaria gallica TaxID=47427 RepID=A0A2H3EYJ0_ARMGA|nr:hypothetical protein ARMGADRAFT_1057157 [Armillaria gallica]